VPAALSVSGSRPIPSCFLLVGLSANGKLAIAFTMKFALPVARNPADFLHANSVRVYRAGCRHDRQDRLFILRANCRFLLAPLRSRGGMTRLVVQSRCVRFTGVIFFSKGRSAHYAQIEINLDTAMVRSFASVAAGCFAVMAWCKSEQSNKTASHHVDIAESGG